MDEALRLTSDKGIFEYCGFQVLRHLYLDSVADAGEAARKSWLEQIAEAAGEFRSLNNNEGAVRNETSIGN